MARTYKPTLAELSASFPGSVFQPTPWLDRATDHAPVTESFTVPASADSEGRYRVILDYAIQSSPPPKVTVGMTELVLVPYGITPAAGEVAVHFAGAPILEFDSTLAGQTGEVEYTPIGSVLNSVEVNQWQLELEAVQSVVDGLGAIDSTGTDALVFELGRPADPDDTDITLLFGDALHYLAWSNPDGGDGRFELSHALSAPAFVGDGSGLTSLPDQHQQNTDTGTTATFFVINSGRSGATAGVQFRTTVTDGDQNWDIYARADENAIIFEKDGVPAVLKANGSELINLNASNLASGTVPDARLSGNVPLLGTGDTRLTLAAPTTGTNRVTLQLAAPTGGTTNRSLVCEGQSLFGDSVTVQRTLSGNTNIVNVLGSGSGRAGIKVDGVGGGHFDFWTNGTQLWTFYSGSSNLNFYNYAGTPGDVLILHGGTNKGASLIANGASGHVTIRHGNNLRFQANADGIGFFGVTPVVQQSMEDLSSAPTESDFNELLGILRAYGLLATSE